MDTMGRRRSLLPPSFHYSSFRIFWLGSLASVAALQMHEFALIWLLFQLTDSGYLLGFAMGLSALPMIISSVVGGVVADWLDRRWLIIATQITLAALLLLLGTLFLLDLGQSWQMVTVFVVIRGVDAAPLTAVFQPSLIK